MAPTAADSAEEPSEPVTSTGGRQRAAGQSVDTSAQRAGPDRRQQLEKRVREHALEVELYLELAALHRAEDRPLEAKRVLQQAMQVDKDNAQVIWQYEEAVLARSMQQLREVSELATRLNTPEMLREVQRSEIDWANRRIEVCRARLAREPDKHAFRLILSEALMDLAMHQQACQELIPCYELDAFAPAARLLQGKCLLAMADDLGALVALRAAGLRRSVHAPLRIRIAALRMASEIAQRMGLALSLQRYTHALELAEQELAAEQAPPQPG